MIFHKNTITNKKIPKKQFYDNCELKPSIKKRFVNEIESIVIVNKFNSETLNIPKTDEVEEILVFDITLKENKYIDKIDEVLMFIDKSVPYPILYQFKIGEKQIYKMAYKKRSQNNPNKSIVDVYLNSWGDDLFLEDIDKIFNALNMKILYDNMMRLFLRENEGDIELAIEKEKKHICNMNEIGKLNKLMRKEKQADKQYKIHGEIKRLEKEIDGVD